MTAKKRTAVRRKKTTCARVWEIADKLHAENVGRHEIITACVEVGINPHTAATQYALWRVDRGIARQSTRAVRSKNGDTPTINDDKVKRIHSTRVENGWGHRTVTIKERIEHIIISPLDVEYVLAKRTERADLIVDTGNEDNPVVRLRRLDTSGRGKEVAQEAKEKVGRDAAAKELKVTASTGEELESPTTHAASGIKKTKTVRKARKSKTVRKKTVRRKK